MYCTVLYCNVMVDVLYMHCSCLTISTLQVFAAVAVSTGCLSFGICMAYTSSALPSMMEQGTISSTEAEWMSQLQSYNINIDG